MKNLNITFEDEEFDYLLSLRNEGDTDSWRIFILELANYKAK